MLGANVKACNMLRNVHHIVDIVRGGVLPCLGYTGYGFFGLAATRMVC